MTNARLREQQLAIDNILMSSYLILEEAKELKANLAMELDLARDRRLAQEREFKAFIAELRETLVKIQAQFRVESKLLNLIRPENKATASLLRQNRNRDNDKITVNLLKPGQGIGT